MDGLFSVVVTNRNNHRLLTTVRINDPRMGVVTNLSQEVWGGGSVTRLTRLTYTQKFFDEWFNLRFGKMTPTEEFFPSSCEFQSLLNCGTVPGISSIWYGWPVSSWGISTTWNISPEVYVKAGVFQQNPENGYNAKAWSLSFQGGKGEIYPVIIGWRPHWGSEKLAGNYFIGAYYSNVTANDVYTGANGGAEAYNPSSGYKQHNNKRSTWAFFEQQLTRRGDNQSQGLSLFINGEINDKSTTVLQYAYGGGIFYLGPFDNRPDDLIGVAATWIKINSRWAKNRAIANEVARISDYSDASYLPPSSGELSAEIFYRWLAAGWISLQPNLQYYHSLILTPNMIHP